jgi:hypothetical protein
LILSKYSGYLFYGVIMLINNLVESIDYMLSTLVFAN